MIRQILVYLAAILLTIYSYFFYSSRIIGMLLAAEVIYLPISLIWLAYLKNKLDISFGQVIPLAEKNKEVPIDIYVKNNSKIPNSIYVKLLIQTENSATGEKEKYYVSCTVPNGGTGKKKFFFRTPQCGIVSVSIRSYWVYDMLFLLKTKKKIRVSESIAVLPETHLLPVEVTRKTREFIADAEEYSDRESGDDPAEIYQIREYRDGDSVHDIHWKLTAKADELRIKEYGRPLGCVVLLWLNLNTVKKKEKYVSSVILEAAASLSLSLLGEKCVHMVAWYEAENHRIQKKRISKEAHIYELLHRLLYATTYQEDTKVYYDDAFRGCSFSTIVEFRVDGTILIDDEEKMKLTLKVDKQKWDEMYFIV